MRAKRKPGRMFPVKKKREVKTADDNPIRSEVYSQSLRIKP
jgi:hypothetical protein